MRRAFQECGANPVVSDDPRAANDASVIIMPGVGAFADSMNNLNKTGWADALRDAVIDNSIPFLGICLGMQVLASWGEEGGRNNGLGFIPGHVKRLQPSDAKLRIPHVGWNEVARKKDSALLNNIPDGSDFYFVHSYHFVADNPESVMTTTPYGDDIVSSLSWKNIHGVQFHPEKSGRSGFQFIKNFLSNAC